MLPTEKFHKENYVRPENRKFVTTVNVIPGSCVARLTPLQTRADDIPDEARRLVVRVENLGVDEVILQLAELNDPDPDADPSADTTRSDVGTAIRVAPRGWVNLTNLTVSKAYLEIYGVLGQGCVQFDFVSELGYGMDSFRKDDPAVRSWPTSGTPDVTASYHVTDVTADASVDVEHDLDSEDVIVVAVESDGTIVPLDDAEVTIVDENNLTVAFDAPFTGRIIVALGYAGGLPRAT